MDFRSMSRRELQALCKRNKIPANITNVAMADALSALPSVEGIEEFLNGDGYGVPESPMREEFVNSENPRTTLRTSTRKTVRDEPITTRTRRAAAAKCTEDSENRDLNVALTTPSLPSGRRRAVVASSACKKVDFQMTDDVAEKEDDDLDQVKNVIEKTPAVPKSQKRVAAASTRRRTETRNNGATEQRGYSTRRSVRLLETTMGSLNLGEDKKMEPITVDMSFDEMPNCTGSVKENSNLEIGSKITDESERKLDDNLELEVDNREKNELASEVKVSEFEELDNNMNVECSPEVEVANEASKDVDINQIVVETNESICESVDSEELSLPHEEETETQVDNVMSSVVESAIEVKDDELEMEEEALDADIEENETVNSMDFPENVSYGIQYKEEALVEVSVTSTEEISNINGVQSIPSFAADQFTLASQFPRPNVEAKSPFKGQAIKLLIDNSDAEDEDEKEQEKASCIQMQIVGKNDVSLRQLKKMFKEKLQLNKKKMDNNNNTKVVGEGKVRTALQPLPENGMAMDE